MDIAWLEDLLALIDCGGFSRAAERRGMSQPSFSRRIRSLEDWVGATLVERGTHTIRLTLAGERFRAVAEETLRRLHLGREDARSAAKSSAETLRFAATHVLSLTFFPAWLRQLEASEPMGATVELTADNMAACERLMVEGRAQFLLCHHHEAASVRLGSDFRSLVLGGDVLLPVAAPDVAGVADISSAPQLCFTAESGMGRILDAAWAAAGKKPPSNPVFSSHLASILTAMARDGRGVAWTALSLVVDDLAAGTLVRAGDPADEVPIEVRLWRSKARQSRSAEVLWSRVLKNVTAA